MAQKINLEQSSDAIQGFMNRTWHNHDASRSFGVTYTNDRSYPIEVLISVDYPLGTTGRQVRLRVNNAAIYDGYLQSATNNNRVILPISTTVPPGATYDLNIIGGSPTIWKWMELY